MAKTFVLGLGVSALLYAGCQRGSNPASPAANIAASQMTNAWAPCVVVQSPAGPAFSAQMNAASLLQRAGKMSWIRLNTDLNGIGLEYHLEARRMGIRILSILALKDLESAGWENAFDRIYATYPSDLWEIAGEVSNAGINPIAVTPDYYMSKFSALYAYVRNRYPGVTLMSAPTFGTG